MLRVTGILFQQLTRKILTQAAMHNPFTLAAYRHRTLPVEGMAVSRNATAAAAGHLKGAGFAAKAASGIDHTASPLKIG